MAEITGTPFFFAADSISLGRLQLATVDQLLGKIDHSSPKSSDRHEKDPYTSDTGRFDDLWRIYRAVRVRRNFC